MHCESVLAHVSQLKKFFPIKEGIIFDRMIGNVRAVDDISFEIYRGETLGLVGESGSGKTTVGRSLLRIIEPTSGRIEFDGRDIVGMNRKEFREIQHRMQMIFQDPYASLNPRIRVEDIVAEPLQIQGALSKREVKDRVVELLELVGLETSYLKRYVHEFSGGQRQRIGIARALYNDPEILIFDEATSALDLDTEKKILETLIKFKKGTDRVLGFAVSTGDRHLLTVETNRGAIQTISTGKYEVVGRGGKGRELLQRGQFTRIAPSDIEVPSLDEN